MKNNSFLFIVLVFCWFSFSQNPDKRLQVQEQNQSFVDTSSIKSNSSGNNIYDKKANIEQYLIVSSLRDSSYVDTTLSIKKDYKFNYLRKDNFGLIPFSNIGQTYNTLNKDFSQTRALPIFGARARHFNYMEINDINYYYVPTPLTELFFKTAFQQGQVLDAFFTVNTSPQFNFSIAYKGLRSLGNYQHILTSTGNLRFTTNFHTKNNRYNVIAHITTQDLLNQENGGITDEDVENFKSGAEDFLDRAVFDPQFQDAESILVGKRFYLQHEYEITKPSDSLSNKLKVGQTIYFEDKYYQFDQNRANEFFGDAFVDQIVDRTTLENFYNSVYFNLKNKLGDFRINLDYSNYNYGYNSVTVTDDAFIPNRIVDNTFSLGASYNNNFGKLNLSTQFQTNISGAFDGYFFKANLRYPINPNIDIHSEINYSSYAPNYNFLLYKSDYINYNWNNIDAFENLNVSNVMLKVEAPKLVNISLDLSSINNYTYFSKASSIDAVKPFQADKKINLVKIRVDKEFNVGKFSLDNSVLYQNVVDDNEILNVPQFTTRNTIYYSNDFFKKALFLQTGITFNYFTEYYMDAYDPLLAEFYIQNKIKLGGYPRLDFFINAKVRQTRIFFKAEHFNSAFTGYNYFSAPNNPYRDFSVRFGLVWNFFL